MQSLIINIDQMPLLGSSRSQTLHDGDEWASAHHGYHRRELQVVLWSEEDRTIPSGEVHQIRNGRRLPDQFGVFDHLFLIDWRWNVAGFVGRTMQKKQQQTCQWYFGFTVSWRYLETLTLPWQFANGIVVSQLNKSSLIMTNWHRVSRRSSAPMDRASRTWSMHCYSCSDTRCGWVSGYGIRLFLSVFVYFVCDILL